MGDVMIHDIVKNKNTGKEYQAVASSSGASCLECALNESGICYTIPCRIEQRKDRAIVIYKQRLTIKKYKELKNAQ